MRWPWVSRRAYDALEEQRDYAVQCSSAATEQVNALIRLLEDLRDRLPHALKAR